MNKLSRRQKWAIAIALLLFAGVKVAMLLWWQQDQHSEQTQVLDCNVRSGCVLPEGGVFQMSAPISAQTPFTMTLSGVDAEQEVTVSFEMADMDMGFNRYRLLVAEGKPETRQAQNVRLPVCATQRLDYIAVVTTVQGQYKIHFNAD